MSKLPSHAKGGRPLLSTQDAAEFLRVCKKTVLRAIKRGELKAHKIGRQWRLRPEDIDSFLAQRATWQRVDVS